jgi:hypothetical protein
MKPPKSTQKSQIVDPSWTLEKNCAFQCVSRERLSYLGSGHYDGHLTVVFARRPYGYFNVLAAHKFAAVPNPQAQMLDIKSYTSVP